MFDSNAYRKEVLRPLLDSGGRDFSDAFALVGLDPEVDQEAVIRSRLDDVVAFWRKEQSSPRYKSLVTALLAGATRSPQRYSIPLVAGRSARRSSPAVRWRKRRSSPVWTRRWPRSNSGSVEFPVTASIVCGR